MTNHELFRQNVFYSFLQIVSKKRLNPRHNLLPQAVLLVTSTDTKIIANTNEIHIFSYSFHLTRQCSLTEQCKLQLAKCNQIIK